MLQDIDFYHSSTTSYIYFFLFPFSESIHCQLFKTEKRQQNFLSSLFCKVFFPHYGMHF